MPPRYHAGPHLIVFLSDTHPANLADKAWIKHVRGVARPLDRATALWIVLAPVRAAEPETGVLFLNGTDPHLPAYRGVHAVMRERLAENATGPILALFKSPRRLGRIGSACLRLSRRAGCVLYTIEERTRDVHI